MRMRLAGGMLPRMENVIHNLLGTHAVSNLGKHEGAVATHFSGVAFHHTQVGAHGFSEVGFADNEKVRLSDSRTAFSGNFIASGNINYLNGVICQLAAETGG